MTQPTHESNTILEQDLGNQNITKVSPVSKVYNITQECEEPFHRHPRTLEPEFGTVTTSQSISHLNVIGTSIRERSELFGYLVNLMARDKIPVDFGPLLLEALGDSLPGYYAGMETDEVFVAQSEYDEEWGMPALESDNEDSDDEEEDIGCTFSVPTPKTVKHFEAQVLGDYLPSFGNILPKVNVEVDIAQQSKELLDNLIKSIEGLQLNEKFESVSEVMGDTITILKQMTTALVIVVAGYLAVTTRSKGWMGAFSLSLMIGGYAFSDHLKPIVMLMQDKFNSWFTVGPTNDDDTFRAEALEDFSSEFISMAALLFVAVTIKKSPSKGMMASVVAAIGTFPRLLDGVAPVLVAFGDMIVKVLNACASFITGNEAPVINLKLDDTEVEAWCDQVIAIRTDFGTPEFIYSLDNQLEVERLIVEGMELLKKDLKGVAGLRVRRVMNEYMRTLNKMLEKIKSLSPDREGFRPQPVAIFLTGAPGVGKTWLAQHLTVDVLAEVVPSVQLPRLRTDWKSFIYCRMPENEYWELYEGQPVIVCDDAFQMRDVPGGTVQEFMECIRMNNNFPFCLHMADVESKGKTFMKARIVLYTSNTEELQSNTIKSIEAVWRRMDFKVKCFPKHEYSITGDPNEAPDNRRLDHSKCPSRFSKDIYLFQEWELKALPGGSSMKITKGVYDYPELKKRIVAMYRRRTETADIYQECIQDAIENTISERLQREADRYADIDEEEIFVDAEDEKVDIRDAVVNPEIFKAQVGPIISMSSLDTVNYEDDELVAFNLDEEFNPCVPFGRWDSLTRKRIKALGTWAMSDIRKMYLWLMIHRDARPHMNDGQFVFLVLKALKLESRTIMEIADMAVESNLNGRCEFFFVDIAMPGMPTLENVYQWGLQATRWENNILVLENEYELKILRQQKDSMLKTIKIAGRTFAAWMHKNPIIKNITIFVMVFATIRGVIAGVSYFASSVKDRFLGSKPVEDGEFRAQYGDDKNCADIAQKICQRSFYKFRFHEKGNVAGYCIIFTGRLAIMPKHYRTVLERYKNEGRYKEDPHFILESQQTGKVYKVPITVMLHAKDHKELRGRDAVMMELPTQFHPHVNLLKAWVSKDMAVDKFPSLSIALWKPIGDTMGAFVSEATHRKITKIELESERFEIEEAFQYRQVQTVQGDCGCPALIYNKSVGPGKILGFHVAGAPNLGGVCNILYREDLEACMEKYDYKPKIAMPDLEDEDEDETNPMDIHTNYCAQFKPPYDVPATPWGEVEKGVHQPVETKIMESPLHGMFGPARTAPANLRNKEFAKAAIVKYCRQPVMNVGVPMWERCAFELGRYMLRNAKARRAAKVFSFEDACVGIPGIPYFNAIPRGTSPGYPYSVNPIPGYPGKSRFFGRAQEYDLGGSETIGLRNRTDKIYDLARQGKRCVHIYTDTFKDERLPIGKGKIRAFSASAVDTTVVMRRLFMDVVAWSFENHVHNGMAPGLNVYSGWPMVATRLARFKKCVAGDYSGFDARHEAEVMECILIIIEQFYGTSSDDPDRVARRVLFEEIMHSVHIHGKKVYQWEGSLPSGAFLTTFVNCICNLMYLMMAYVYLVPGQNFEQFFDHVSPVVYGDDNMMSIDDEVIEEFNGQSIQRFMPQINQEYTAEDKSPVMYKYKDMSEITFLKRSIRYEPKYQTWVAPLSMDTIMESPYWYRAGPNIAKTIETNIDNFFLEGSLHGEAKFIELQKWAPEIRDRSGYSSPWATEWRLTFEYMLTREDYL